jgi:hypothetical protein
MVLFPGVGRWSVVSGQLSVGSWQLTVDSGRWSVVSGQLTVVSRESISHAAKPMAARPRKQGDPQISLKTPRGVHYRNLRKSAKSVDRMCSRQDGAAGLPAVSPPVSWGAEHGDSWLQLLDAAVLSLLFCFHRSSSGGED